MDFGFLSTNIYAEVLQNLDVGQEIEFVLNTNDGESEMPGTWRITQVRGKSENHCSL